jgi:hypothetical protein
MAVVWRDEAVPVEVTPSALGEVVILPSQQPMMVEALNHAVRFAS